MINWLGIIQYASIIVFNFGLGIAGIVYIIKNLRGKKNG